MAVNLSNCGKKVGFVLPINDERSPIARPVEMAGRSRQGRGTQSCVIEDENSFSSEDSFHEFEEITQVDPASTQIQTGNPRRRSPSSFIPYVHYVHESKLDQYQRSFGDQIDSKIESIIQSCECLAEIGQFDSLEPEIDAQLLNIFSLKISFEENLAKVREVLNLIDHTGDLNALERLWTMSGFGGENGDESVPKKSKSKTNSLKRMPKKFTQYKSRIWDIANPYDSMPISYAQEPMDRWLDERKRNRKDAASQKEPAANNKKASSEEEDEEDIIFADGRSLPVKCPITLQLFVDPVKNKLCNHVYSRLSIDQYVSSAGGRATCPVVGCSSIVTKESIAPDLEVQAKLDRIALMRLFKEQKDSRILVTQID